MYYNKGSFDHLMHMFINLSFSLFADLFNTKDNWYILRDSYIYLNYTFKRPMLSLYLSTALRILTSHDSQQFTTASSIA